MFSTMKLAAAVSLAMALLLVATPALATVRPDDRSGIRTIGTAVLAQGLRPDDRAGLRGAVESNPASVAGALGGDVHSLRPDDRAGYRGILGQPQPISVASRSPVAATDHGFDWMAAGAGAGVAAATGILLLLTWALTLRRGQRRSGVAA
jgi:hypothetical protein